MRRQNTMRGRHLWMGLVVVLALAACGGDDEPESEVERISGADIPVQDPDLVADGADLYAANCAECHGGDLQGTDQGPPHLSWVYEPNHHGDAAFELAVLNGVRAHHWGFGDMPPIDGLDKSAIDAIVAFVRETQRTEGFEPWP